MWTNSLTIFGEHVLSYRLKSVLFNDGVVDKFVYGTMLDYRMYQTAKEKLTIKPLISLTFFTVEIILLPPENFCVSNRRCR